MVEVQDGKMLRDQNEEREKIMRVIKKETRILTSDDCDINDDDEDEDLEIG